ncbi:MAG TPA: NAD(+)/NADH kinase [Candidatus Nanoarchaeia archaeon]|nr:NAD(+)/NADH kinase [Candidatus Nanoarchaeia archaeon]
MNLHDVLVVYMRPDTAAGRRTLEIVKQTLLHAGVAALIVERNRVDQKCCWQKDLIITVGGDGTFLRASHFVEDVPMLGVNSEPKRKVGFFTRSTAQDFAEKFQRLRNGKYHLRQLPRLKVHIDGDEIPERALNEVFFGDRLPFKMCRYQLRVEGKKEEQRSSGVLISTGAGSHAWMQSAGGKRFSLTAEKMEYLVREPYHDLNRKGMLHQGFTNRKIHLLSRDTNNFLVIDALSKTYPMPVGSRATIELAKRKIQMVDF